MREFRPESWQKQARRLGDGLFIGFLDNTRNEKQIIDFFALGYNYFPMGKQRRKYVEQRAAKRVGRLIREEIKK
jgi:hypothetical protein